MIKIALSTQSTNVTSHEKRNIRTLFYPKLPFYPKNYHPTPCNIMFLKSVAVCKNQAALTWANFGPIMGWPELARLATMVDLSSSCCPKMRLGLSFSLIPPSHNLASSGYL